MVIRKLTLLITVFLIGETAAQISPNPLAGLPSAPGSTIAQIQALGDNAWLDLGAPEADPDWGRAYGRAWGGRGFVLAPSIRGAFLCGEGVHAFVKADDYGQDDYWVYDINAHKWICIYPGMDTKGFNQKVIDGGITLNSNGHVVNAQGEILPGHLLIHAFGLVTYDTDLKKFVHMGYGNSQFGYGRYYMPGLSDIDEGLTTLENAGLGGAGDKDFSPWFYNIQTGQFEIFESNSRFYFSSGGGLLQYLPHDKKYLYATGNDWAYFDPATNLWTKIPEGNARGSASLGIYDSKRELVYLGSSLDAFYKFDSKTNAYTKLSGSAPGSPSFSNNQSGMSYDSINDMVIFLNFGGQTVYTYNPETDTWGSAGSIPGGFSNTNGTFYDSELNAHFVFTAGDSRDNGKIWVYRYKRQGSAVGKAALFKHASPPVLEVRPNPVTRQGTVIHIKNVSTSGPLNLVIYDVRGKAVARFDGREFFWAAQGVTSGVYVIKARFGNRVISRRLLVQK
jgi:hypothetical protein